MNLIEHREKQNLTLRKQKINEYILEKRFKNYTQSKFGLNKFILNVDSNIINIKASEINNLGISNLIFDLLNSAEDNQLKFGVILIREFLSIEGTLEIGFLLERGIIEFCMSILKDSQDQNLIYEVIWILINISYISNYDTNIKLISENNLQIFTDLLKRIEISELTIQIFWLFQNIISDANLNLRNILLNSIIIDHIYEDLIKVIENEKYNDIRKSFFRSSIKLFYHMVNKEKIPEILNKQIYKICEIFTNISLYKDDEVFSDCIWGVMFISAINENNNSNIPKIILANQGNFILTLLALDYERDYKDLLIPAIRILGNVISYEDSSFVDFIIDLGLLEFIDSILTNYKSKQILAHAVWLISNLTAGNEKHVRDVVESEIFNKLLKLTTDYDYTVKKEAVMSVLFICLDSNFSLTTDLIKKGIFRLIFDLIELRSDLNIIEMALNSLVSLLNSGECVKLINSGNPFCKKFVTQGGMIVLESLQSHPNQNIYYKSVKIMDMFFKSEDLNREDIMMMDENLFLQNVKIINNNNFVYRKNENLKFDNNLNNGNNNGINMNNINSFSFGINTFKN